VGWGNTFFDDETGNSSRPSQVLKHSRVKTVDVSMERRIVVGDAGRRGAGNRVMRGDSGGPMVCRDPRDRRTKLCGIAVSGHRREWAIFARVSYFHTWMLEEMEAEKENVMRNEGKFAAFLGGMGALMVALL